MELNQIHEFMTTEEIFEAWDDILNYAAITLEAVKNRLEDLGFDDDEYEDGSNDEIEKLLEMRDTIDSVYGL